MKNTKRKGEISSLVWGPKYWFVLHSIAYHYPDYPNEVTKRKYYDFIQNVPLFLPNIDMGNNFTLLLDKYPVTPYLDCRDSFIRWVHFIHNKINIAIKKNTITLSESLEQYHELDPQDIVIKKFYFDMNIETRKQLFQAFLIFVCLCFIFTWL